MGCLRLSRDLIHSMVHGFFHRLQFVHDVDWVKCVPPAAVEVSTLTCTSQRRFPSRH